MAEKDLNRAADAAWSRKVAELAVDALVEAKIVARDDFERAVDVVTEEILVRLTMDDRRE
jgi:hypothetical protein